MSRISLNLDRGEVIVCEYMDMISSFQGKYGYGRQGRADQAVDSLESQESLTSPKLTEARSSDLLVARDPIKTP